jgi:hypothetical protein
MEVTELDVLVERLILAKYQIHLVTHMVNAKFLPKHLIFKQKV